MERAASLLVTLVLVTPALTLGLEAEAIPFDFTAENILTTFDGHFDSGSNTLEQLVWDGDTSRAGDQPNGEYAITSIGHSASEPANYEVDGRFRLGAHSLDGFDYSGHTFEISITVFFRSDSQRVDQTADLSEGDSGGPGIAVVFAGPYEFCLVDPLTGDRLDLLIELGDPFVPEGGSIRPLGNAIGEWTPGAAVDEPSSLALLGLGLLGLGLHRRAS